MNFLLWPASLAGLISTAVIFGTDMFFLTVGSQIGSAIHRSGDHGIYPSLRG